jgi:hypothetical protein
MEPFLKRAKTEKEGNWYLGHLPTPNGKKQTNREPFFYKSQSRKGGKITLRSFNHAK